MNIDKIPNNQAAIAVSKTPVKNDEETLEIKNGTTEESMNMKKMAENQIGMGNKIDTNA